MISLIGYIPSSAALAGAKGGKASQKSHKPATIRFIIVLSFRIESEKMIHQWRLESDGGMNWIRISFYVALSEWTFSHHFCLLLSA
jgi:hypothetical protein